VAPGASAHAGGIVALPPACPRGSKMARPSRSLLLNAVGVAVLFAVLVVAGRLTSGTLRPPATTASVPVILDHPTPTVPSPVVARIRFRQPVTGVAVGPDAVWVAHGCAISRVDPMTNRVVARVAGIRPRRDGCAVLGVRVGAGAVWASLWGRGLLRIDPRRNRVAALIAVPDIAAPPAVTATGVWVLCCGATTRPGRWLLRVDPASNLVLARIRLGGLPDAVGAGPSGVWVAAAGGRIWRVARLQEPVLPKCHTRFRFPWQWKGREVILMSRCIDETGYVQPSREALTAVRGFNSVYHYNAIQSWKVARDGSVSHDQV